MFKRKILGQAAFLTVLLALTVWFLNNGFAGNEQLYFKTDKGLFYLKQVYETISRNYVDDVDPEGLSKSAIKGIVGELDPYTVFYEKKGSEHLEIITKGKYGGLGMEIGRREGKITVISPIDNTPAQRAGIRAGDIISKINKKPTGKMTLEDASSKLRGKVGTEVEIEIERPGISEPIQLTLTREEIVLKDVSYSDFVEAGTAYFRLTGFSDKAADELRQAIRNLQKSAPIERVILDLRGNPGGLLNSAVEVANIFIPKGEVIVETRGTHEREAKFVTSRPALLPDVPLAVLVDAGSASASEIVAGAVQDLDRGAILGSATFGKGLVQQVYPVDKINDAYLKITTAKYYVPSGRCIQKEDYKKNKKVFLDVSDSLEFDNHKKYFTRNGRPVYGGGGIKPDIEVQSGKMDQLLVALWARGHFFRFTVDYLAEHPELKAMDYFSVTDEVLDAFNTYLESKKFDFSIKGEEELKKFLKVAEQENYSEDVRDLAGVALKKLEKEKTGLLAHGREEIRRALEIEFAEKFGGNSARLAARLKKDKVLEEALKLFKDNGRYMRILAVK